MGITVDQLRAIFRDCPDPVLWAPLLSAAWDEFGVRSLYATASHLAIIGNETGGLASVGREDMRYTPDRAFQLFPKARQFPATTRDRLSTVRQDRGRRFASWLYADLYGNGPEQTEDGWNYRGGGITQLTFRSAYAAAAKALSVDLVGNPDLIVDPPTSARASAWFITQYKPQILPLFARPDENSFLAGARHVGWTDPPATERRLIYRRNALAVLVAGTSTLADADLRRGSKGEAVKALQQALLRAGCDLPRFGADGDFGDETVAALLHFQEFHGLPQTGIADADTRRILGI